jgi:methyl-accepting chemotaxis protein
VKAGSTSVQAAGQNMSEVMSRIEQVSCVIGEINHSLAVQCAGIDEIDRSIAELDNATQQNSALVEQTSAASASLAEQAVTLSRAVAAFKLAERVPA